MESKASETGSNIVGKSRLKNRNHFKMFRVYRLITITLATISMLSVSIITAGASDHILFKEDFEKENWKDNWSHPHWGQDGIMERVTGHPKVFEGKASLRVKLKMSNAKTQNQVIRHFLKDKDHSHLFMRWYQMVEGGDFFTKSNKLELKGNSLYGWIIGKPWPQNLDSENPKFTFRASMKSFYGVFMYSYLGKIGEVNRIGYHDQSYHIRPDTWHCVEIELKANTIDKKDGELRMWVDGALKSQKTGLFLRGESKMRIQAIEDVFKLTRYSNTGAANATATIWRDAVVVSTKRIECADSNKISIKLPPPSDLRRIGLSGN